MAYNKADLVSKVAQKSNLTKAQSESAINAFQEVLIDSLKSGEGLKLTGIFSAERVKRAERTDLIGYGKHCLVRPDKGGAPAGAAAQGKRNRTQPEQRKKPVKKAEENRSNPHSAKKVGWAKAKPKNTKGRGINKKK